MRLIKTIDEATHEYNGVLVNIEMTESAERLPDGTVIVRTISGEEFTVPAKDFDEATRERKAVPEHLVKRLIDSLDKLCTRLPSSVRVHL